MNRTLTVRLFAAAREAAGTSQTSLASAESAVTAGDTVGDVVDLLVARYGGEGGEFARVVSRCSFLLDGEQARRSTRVGNATTLDVLPPFAGG